MSEPHVLIIGGGTTGLLLAQGLKQANINATVFERETPETYLGRSREWGLSLHWGNEVISKVLPPTLQARIREIWCDPHYVQPPVAERFLPHYAGHTGEQLFATPADDAMRVSRSKMRKLFSEGLDIQYGKRLIDVSKGSDCTVVASFEDDRIVARRVRWLSMDLAMFNFPCKFDAETAKLIRKQHPIFFNSYHPKGRMLWISLLFSWPTPPSREDFVTRARRTAFLKAMTDEYAEPWRTIVQKVPDDLEFSVDGVTVWSPFDWSASPLSGCATLAGDGAHPMCPYRGQGLNNGLDDATKLTALLSSVDCTRWPEAVKQYEVEMRERILREIPISAATATMVHDYEQLLKSPIAKFGIRRPKAGDVPTMPNETES